MSAMAAGILATVAVAPRAAAQTSWGTTALDLPAAVLAELESLMSAGDYIETWKFIEQNIFSIK